MKIVDLSQHILDDLGDYTNISLPSVATYLRQNIGKLNDILNTTYTLNTQTLDIVQVSDGITEIGWMEAAIYAQIYEVYYFQRRANAVAGAISIDTVIQYTADGGTLRLIDRIQLVKTYNEMKKSAEDTLKMMVNRYKFYTTSAIQVIGNDMVHHEFPLEFLRRNLLT